MLKRETITKEELLKEVEALGDITEGRFPTVEEIDEDMEEEVPYFLIAYFSTDPFKRFGIAAKDDIDYQDMVSYCQLLLKDMPDEISLL